MRFEASGIIEVQTYPLVLTVLMPARCISNKYSTFSLIKRSAEEDKRHLTTLFLYFNCLKRAKLKEIKTTKQHLFHNNEKSHFFSRYLQVICPQKNHGCTSVILYFHKIVFLANYILKGFIFLLATPYFAL